MKQKKSLRLVLLITIAGLLLVALFNYTVDPFCYYRMPSNGMLFISYGEMEQNLNLAKNDKYNAVITGTSMCENFRSSWFNETYGCHAEKLTFAGGQTKDFTQLFDAVFNSGNDVDYVFYGVDIYTLLSNPESTRFEYQKYQISSNPFYDVQYLLNKDVLMKYSVTSYANAKNHSGSVSEVPDDIYIWDKDDTITYSKDAALASYTRPDVRDVNDVNEYDNVAVNLEMLGKFIGENQSTQFYLFFPPYSILYWDSMSRTRKLQTQIATLESASEYFLQYDNVHLYSYITDTDIIEDLSNYKDYTHYRPEVNQMMLQGFSTEEYLLTKENYHMIFDQFEKHLELFDYDQYFD